MKSVILPKRPINYQYLGMYIIIDFILREFKNILFQTILLLLEGGRSAITYVCN